MQKHNKKYKKLFVVTLFFILISMSAAQALVKNNISDKKELVSTNETIVVNDPQLNH